MCTLCEKQTGEWSPICEMKKIHDWESEEERCVETTVTSPPTQNNLPARTGLLCGLFTLRAIPDSTAHCTPKEKT